MRFPKLRIACSIASGILGALLVVLWVQNHGKPAFVPADIPGEPIPNVVFLLLSVPFFAVMCVAAYPVLLECRFSLRTLLIATTLASLILAIIYYIMN
jgi:hypothetical protein